METSWERLGSFVGTWEVSLMRLGSKLEDVLSKIYVFKEIGGCPKQNPYFWMYKEELDTKVGVLIVCGDNLKNKYCFRVRRVKVALRFSTD